MNGLGMWRARVSRDVVEGLGGGNRREGNQGGDLGIDGWILLERISRRWDVSMWTGLGWPRIRTVGGRL